LQYLTAAGVGHIGIIDHDKVDISNLQRQVVFSENDIGLSKAEMAKKNLLKLNSQIDIAAINDQINKNNILNLISSYEIIVDTTDNFNAHYLINDACVTQNKINVYASIYQFDGICTVFSGQLGYPCYRCLFPNLPPTTLIPNCVESGVLGVLPGVMGSIQATEVLKLLLNIGKLTTI